MKTILTLTILTVIFIPTLWAQSKNNVTFFTVHDEPFILVLNGRKINKKPEGSVTDTNVASRIRVKIVFENSDLGEVSDNFTLNGQYYAHSFMIEVNKKGVYKISRDATDALPRPAPAYSPPPVTSPPQQAPQVIIVSGNGGTIGQCYVADEEMPSILKAIRSEIGSSSQQTAAVSIIRNKNQCFTSLQIKQIVSIFRFDDDRFTLAKYGYDYAKDRSNYYTVGDVFSSPFRKAEFMLFLGTK